MPAVIEEANQPHNPHSDQTISEPVIEEANEPNSPHSDSSKEDSNLLVF